MNEIINNEVVNEVENKVLDKVAGSGSKTIGVALVAGAVGVIAGRAIPKAYRYIKGKFERKTVDRDVYEIDEFEDVTDNE